MASWADLPLADLGRDRRRVVARHDEITAEAGPYAANHAMRALRAVYNEAMRVDPDLPPNPVRAVTFNTERRRDTGMGPDDLPAWWAQLQALGNPIRRELHLMTLLTGSRPEALRTARWEHIDVRRRVLHIPRPKGGERRAFDIPLSRAIVRSLVRARRAGMVLHPRQSAEWVFPADSVTGHIVEHKEDRARLAKWGGDLRQTFRNMCALAGIDPLTSRLLMNHVVDRDVHDGYITKSALMGSLRVHQQRLSTFIMAALTRPAPKTADPAPALPTRIERKPARRVARATATTPARKPSLRTAGAEARA
jgi:integrase